MASRPEIVIGIDFGTTHSGFSWAVNAGLKRVYLVTDWETSIGASCPTNEKVATRISYTGNRPTSYGYTAVGKPFRWFKILLQPGHYSEGFHDVEVANQGLKEISKSLEDVISDYLRWLWARGKEDIARKQGRDFEKRYKLRVILTVPAAWEHIAKDRTLNAAKKAGLPMDTELVTEPEAASLATLNGISEDEGLKLGDVFVVCDAGGGTVDLISYEVLGTKPLKIRECSVGEGGLCGSAFLDIGFERLIKTKIGEARYNRTKEKDRKKMLDDFENRIKPHFDGDDKRTYSVELRGAGDNPDEDEDMICIKGSAISNVFDPVCDQIDTLVTNQIDQMKVGLHKTKTILLVGGFGSSKYLHSRLEKTYRGLGINVIQSKDPWSAVCRGATMWGLENAIVPSIVSRKARYSYGYTASSKFMDGTHDERDKYWDPADGCHRATSQMFWILKWGDEIKAGDVLQWSTYMSILNSTLDHSKSYNFTECIYYSEEKQPPNRKADGAKSLASIDFEIESSILRMNSKLRTGADGNKYYNVDFDMKIELRNADLGFDVFCVGEKVGHVEVNYKENF